MALHPTGSADAADPSANNEQPGSESPPSAEMGDTGDAADSATEQVPPAGKTARDGRDGGHNRGQHDDHNRSPEPATG